MGIQHPGIRSFQFCIDYRLGMDHFYRSGRNSDRDPSLQDQEHSDLDSDRNMFQPEDLDTGRLHAHIQNICKF